MPTRHRWLITLAPLFMATACMRGPRERPDAFHWQESLPAGSTLHIRDGVGDITVTASPAPITTVSAGTQWNRGNDRDITFAVERHGSDVYICAMWRASGGCRTGYRGRRSQSFLSFLALFRHASDATAHFEVGVPAGVSVDALTTLGGVHVSGVTAGITAHSTSGDVSALGARGPISLFTSNGDVHLSVDSLTGTDSVNLQTRNGSIHAEFPADLQGQVDMSTLNGDLSSDFPVGPPGEARRKHIQTQLGTAQRVLRFKTLNGEIALVKRQGGH